MDAMIQVQDSGTAKCHLIKAEHVNDYYKDIISNILKKQFYLFRNT